MTSTPVGDIINIIYTTEDIEDFAAEHDIEVTDELMQNVESWASAIQDTACQLIQEQLDNVVQNGQP